MKSILRMAMILCGTLTATSLAGEIDISDMVVKHILDAHKHDAAYTRGPEASQAKALHAYELALGAGAAGQMRLHVLYRMARLYGAEYHLEKGEKPDFRKAISLYHKIIDEYPGSNPKVIASLVFAGDNYASLLEFQNACDCYRRALEFDVREIERQIAALPPSSETNQRPATLENALADITRFQQAAVDNLGYVVALKERNKIAALAELDAIIKKHPGTFIAARAQKNRDRISNQLIDTSVPNDLSALDDHPRADRIEGNAASSKSNEQRTTRDPLATRVSDASTDRHVYNTAHIVCLLAAAGIAAGIVVAIQIRRKRASLKERRVESG